MVEAINDFHTKGAEDHDSSPASNGLSLLDLLDRTPSSSRPRSTEDIMKDLSTLLSDDHLYPGGSKSDSLPVLGKDSHYGIDPVTGNVKAYPSVHTDLWTKADRDAADTINKRGYSYGLDPVSGQVSRFPNMRTDLYTKNDADRDRTIRDRGWYYGLNPSTGRVVRCPAGPQLE